MALISLAEAAKAVGRTKPALLSAINKGRLSAKKNDHGEWEVDPAELFRVYKPAKDEAETANQDITLLTAEKEAQNRELKARLEVMEQLVSELRADKEDLRQREAELRRDLDQWRGFAFDAQQRLKALEAPKMEAAQSVVIETEAATSGGTASPKKGLFRRLFSRG